MHSSRADLWWRGEELITPASRVLAYLEAVPPSPCPRLLSNPHSSRSPSPFLSSHPFFFPRRKVNVQDGDETERERKKCEITDEYTRLKIIVISHFFSHLPQRGGLFIVKRDQNQNKKFLSLSENLFVVFVKKIFPKKRIIKIKGKKKNSNDLPKNPTPFNYTILRYSTYEDRENKICIPAGMRGIKGETSDK